MTKGLEFDQEVQVVLEQAARLAIQFRDMDMLVATVSLGLDPFSSVLPGDSHAIAALVVASGWTDALVLISDSWPRSLMS